MTQTNPKLIDTNLSWIPPTGYILVRAEPSEGFLVITYRKDHDNGESLVNVFLNSNGQEVARLFWDAPPLMQPVYHEGGLGIHKEIKMSWRERFVTWWRIFWS